MERISEVVVIGGGCVGASIAYHLVEAGCTDVLLLESDVLGSGATSKAAGGIRLQHTDPLNTRLAQRSLEEFGSFADFTGAEIGFKQVGYLFLIDNSDDLDLFTSAALMQRELGVPVEHLSPEAALDLVPQLDLTGLLAASYCPIEGYATPEAVVQGYAAAARRRGARLGQGTRVERIVTANDRIVGVDTADGRISAGAVVCAAGTGSAVLAASAGVRIPITGQPRRIFYSSQAAGLPDGIPLTVDFSSGFYFHREGRGLVFAGREFEAEDLMAPALRRLPALGDLPITTSWHGDYDLSPDDNGIVGASEEVAGLYYATGFSGHGFMLSPAVGEHIAELILGRTPTIDLSPLSARRFASQDDHRRESIVI